MSQAFTVKWTGLNELRAALYALDPELTQELKTELGALGGIVWDDITSRAARFDSAYTSVSSQIATKIRGTSVSIESTARKTADEALRRPNLATELKEDAFDTAGEAHKEELYLGVEAAVERLKLRHGFE